MKAEEDLERVAAGTRPADGITVVHDPSPSLPDTRHLHFSRPHRPPALRAFNLGARPAVGRLERFSLDEASCRDAAEKATGLRDYGSDEYVEPLRTQLDCFEHESRLTPFGRTRARAGVVSFLANRLRFQELWSQHPEILDLPVERPIFVVGLPRTGSTFLQHLLAQDPTNRSLLQWEVARPLPPPEERTYLSDPRIEEARRGLAVFDRLCPAARAIHPVSATLPTECVAVLATCFSNLDAPTMYWMPSYLPAFLDWDLAPHYRYLKRVLQTLQWKVPRERWQLKCPAHSFAMEAISEVFPDALFVQTHRDPTEVLPSFCSLSAHLIGINSDRVDQRGIGRAWLEMWSAGLDRIDSARERLGAERLVDVAYEDLLANPVGEVARIYDRFGIRLLPSALTGMSRHIVQNPQHREGVHRYSLDQFGLTSEEVRRQLGRPLNSFEGV